MHDEQILAEVREINQNLRKLCGLAAEKMRAKSFEPPTLEEVLTYCRENALSIDAKEFFCYYEGNGWMVGKVPMRNWRMVLKGWELYRKRNDSRQEEARLRAKRPENWHQGSKEMYEDVIRVLGG